MSELATMPLRRVPCAGQKLSAYMFQKVTLLGRVK
jgi:hypothetical protein